MTFSLQRSSRDRICEACKEVIPAGSEHKVSSGGVFYHTIHQPQSSELQNYNSGGYAVANPQDDYWERIRLNKDLKKYSDKGRRR